MSDMLSPKTGLVAVSEPTSPGGCWGTPAKTIDLGLSGFWNSVPDVTSLIY